MRWMGMAAQNLPIIEPLASMLGAAIEQPDVLSTRLASAAATDWTYGRAIAPKLYN